MIKHHYGKAAVMSLLIHVVLFGILTIGYSSMFTPPAVISPIEVEFLMANVADRGDSLNKVNSPPAPAALQPEQQTKSAGSVVKQETVPPKSSRQPEVNEPSTLPATARETMTEVVTTEVGSGNAQELPANSPSNRATLRSQPGYISGPRPAYPQDARRAGQEGTVVIRTLVGTDGSAADVAVLTSSGYASLDEAAVRAVKKWRFAPARYGSTAVESYYDVRVKFRLDDWP